MESTVFCKKLNENLVAFNTPPYPGPLGERIKNEISTKAWEMWLNHQTMLINENRLSLADSNARQFLRQEMERFLFGDGSKKPEGYTPLPKE